MGSIPVHSSLNTHSQSPPEIRSIQWIEASVNTAESNKYESNFVHNVDNSPSGNSSDSSDQANLSDAQLRNNAYNSDHSSIENTFEEDRSSQWKRKRQEEKTKCEQNRRMRFNEQMDMLRSLVTQKNIPNLQYPKTREDLLGAAIEEILKLRKGMAEMNQITNFCCLSSQFDLSDPYNRASYSKQDLEHSFRVMYSRQLELQFNMSNMGKKCTSQDLVAGHKMLYDVAKQIGTPQHHLRIAALERSFYTMIKFNPNEISRVVDNNWTQFQEYLNSNSERIFLFDTDIGVLLFAGAIAVHYAQGNSLALEHTHHNLKKYLRKTSVDTKSLKLAFHMLRTNPGALSLPVAKKIHSMLEFSCYDHIGKISLGIVMINNCDFKNGVELVERAIMQALATGKQNTTHLFLAPVVLEAYLRAGYVTKGLRFAHYALNVFEQTDTETYLGKAELLRLKANLLILKQCPDFMPEPQVGGEDADRYAEDLIAVYETLPKAPPYKPRSGPLPRLTMLDTPVEDEENPSDIESLFKLALELARSKDLVIVELRCSVDLLRYYMHIGNMEQAWNTVPIVKEVMSRMKGNPNKGELHRANFVISLVNPTCIFGQV
mmetsp:Transcript_3218/g.4434  ORF Transcript_3218/g.4434 Transcript_3218/m.4434 type:complete len:602 (+) Transcript_3218:2-1807(+)